MEKNVKTHLMYSAKLNVFRAGETVTYETLEEADDRLQQQVVIIPTDQSLHWANGQPATYKPDVPEGELTEEQETA